MLMKYENNNKVMQLVGQLSRLVPLLLSYSESPKTYEDLEKLLQDKQKLSVFKSYNLVTKAKKNCKCIPPLTKL